MFVFEPNASANAPERPEPHHLEIPVAQHVASQSSITVTLPGISWTTREQTDLQTFSNGN